METDFKLSRLQYDRDGQLVSVVARIYEGDTSAQDERDLTTGEMVSVTRYRRTALLREVTFSAATARKLASVTELKLLLAGELRADSARTPIDGQTLTKAQVTALTALKQRIGANG